MLLTLDSQHSTLDMRKSRLVPPAGAPIPLKAVVTAALGIPRDSGQFVQALRTYLGVDHIFLTASGRAALTILLNVLRQQSSRCEVIIPAFTCFSVPSAVVRAGLVIRLCDVDPKTLDLDHNALARLDLDKVLCIVPSSLYGMPSGLFELEEIARAAGVYLIDDAAQSLGAKVGEKSCGTFGDAGFYSLGRGKNISTMGGGIIITQRGDLAQLIEQKVNKLPRPSSVSVLPSTLSSLLYAVMLPPSRYWIVNRIPLLGLGSSVFDPNFTITRLSKYQERLASQVLPLIRPYNVIRSTNASQLQAGIEGVEGIEIPRAINGATPVYLRLPILVRDRKHRSRLLNRLKVAGIGASPSYPSSICDIPGIQEYLARDQQPCPGAVSIAERIITLPTHPYVTVGDVDRMIGIVRKGG